MPEIKIAQTPVGLDGSAQLQLAAWYRQHCDDNIVELKVWFMSFKLKLSVLEGLFEMLTGEDLDCDG